MERSGARVRLVVPALPEAGAVGVGGSQWTRGTATDASAQPGEDPLEAWPAFAEAVRFDSRPPARQAATGRLSPGPGELLGELEQEVFDRRAGGPCYFGDSRRCAWRRAAGDAVKRVRLHYCGGKRDVIAIPLKEPTEVARATVVLKRMAKLLTRAGESYDKARAAPRETESAVSVAEYDQAAEWAERTYSGVKVKPAKVAALMTVEQLGTKWTKGGLLPRHPHWLRTQAERARQDAARIPVRLAGSPRRLGQSSARGIHARSRRSGEAAAAWKTAKACATRRHYFAVFFEACFRASGVPVSRAGKEPVPEAISTADRRAACAFESHTDELETLLAYTGKTDEPGVLLCYRVPGAS